MKTNELEIQTEYVYPPIPIRSFDWRAWVKDEERGVVGWGFIEQEAIDDLKENLPG